MRLPIMTLQIYSFWKENVKNSALRLSSNEHVQSLSGSWTLWADRRRIIYSRLKAAGLQHACTANEASSGCVSMYGCVGF